MDRTGQSEGSRASLTGNSRHATLEPTAHICASREQNYSVGNVTAEKEAMEGT